MEEYETLTNSEKATAIRSKIKGIQYSKYNIELDILSENSVSSPNFNQIEEWNRQLADINARQAALETELENISLDI